MRPKIVWLGKWDDSFPMVILSRINGNEKKKKIKKSNPFDLMLPGYYKSDIPC